MTEVLEHEKEGKNAHVGMRPVQTGLTRRAFCVATGVRWNFFHPVVY